MRLEFFDDPARFLAEATDLLAARPVLSTVVASVTARMVRDGSAGVPVDEAGFASWWLLVRAEDGTAVGAAMRTAPFAPYPPYLLEMPEDAARELARVLHGRGEPVSMLNGALPAVAVLAEELAVLTGGSVRTAEELRLYEIEAVEEPGLPPGTLREAREDELDVVLAWFDAFAADAAEQAGAPHPHPSPIETPESALARIRGGEVWVWDVDGAPVHVTAFNPPSFGVARVGPVYTPKEQRGSGYAAAAVAEVSRMLLDDGSRVCLFADVANPTSTGVYVRLGYRPVVDMANLIVD